MYTYVYKYIYNPTSSSRCRKVVLLREMHSAAVTPIKQSSKVSSKKSPIKQSSKVVREGFLRLYYLSKNLLHQSMLGIVLKIGVCVRARVCMCVCLCVCVKTYVNIHKHRDSEGVGSAQECPQECQRARSSVIYIYIYICIQWQVIRAAAADGYVRVLIQAHTSRYSSKRL